MDAREVGRGRQEEGSAARRRREEGGAAGSAAATATRVTAIASGEVGEAARLATALVAEGVDWMMDG